MADDMEPRTPGLPEVLLVGGAVVAGVLALIVITGFVPELRDLLTSTPLAILVLVVGTVAILALAGIRRRRE